MTTDPLVPLFAEVWASLAALGDELADADWDTPTDCPGWDVRDNYSHMIGTEKMLLGDPAPAPAAGDLGHVHNDIGRANEAWVAQRRGRPGPEVLAEFRDVTGRRLAALEAKPAADWDAPSFTPRGKGTYRDFMEVRVFDCWMHEQDVRRAVGRPGHLSGPVVERSLDEMQRALPFVVGKKAGAAPDVTVVFRITGESGRDIAVGFPPDANGRAGLLDVAPAEPTVTITADVEAFVLRAGGRVDAAPLLADGRISLAGDDTLARRIVDELAFVI